MFEDPDVQKKLAQKIRAMTIDKCTHCKGSGYTEHIANRGKTLCIPPCSCVEEFDRLASWARSGIPERYWPFELTLDVLDRELKLRNATALKILMRYAERLDKMLVAGAGLYITGEVGLGKSALAACILKEALSRGYSCQFVTLAQLVSMSFQSRRDEEVREELHAFLTSVDFLVIDEVDKLYKSQGQVEEMLDTIFRQRYFAKKPLIVTSNLDRKELPYGTNIADIFSEVLIDVKLVGTSLREKRGNSLMKLLQ